MSIKSRIKSALAEIKSPDFDPMTHAMPNRLSGWRSVIGDLPDWAQAVEVIREANLIRGEDFSITRQQMLNWVKAGVPLRLRLLLSLLWGYGAGKGRGRNAVSSIMRSIGLDFIICETGSCLEKGDVAGAFKSLSGLDGLGLSFVSKFLYFETRSADGAAARCCLIFDNRVSRNLVRLAVDHEDLWLCDVIDMMRRDKWASYKTYCRNIRTLASEFEIAPDRLELWLYRTADESIEDSLG